MNLFSNLRSLLHTRPKELIVPGNIPATLTNCGGSLASATQFPEVMDYFARELLRQNAALLHAGSVDCVIAAACPESMILSGHLAHQLEARFASLTNLRSPSPAARHQLVARERVVLVLDECRNFIRLNEAMTQISASKAHLTAVLCILNASGRKDYSYQGSVPILSLAQESQAAE